MTKSCVPRYDHIPPLMIKEEIQQTQKRCDMILECKHQIEYWKAKLEVLEEEQSTCIKLARLRMDAATTWRSLSKSERLEKKFILAALESPELPNSLKVFPNSSFPAHIRLDRDILLARVSRSDFGQYLKTLQTGSTIATTTSTSTLHTDKPPVSAAVDDIVVDDDDDASIPDHSSTSPTCTNQSSSSAATAGRTLFLPHRLRGDKEVILALLPSCPHVIETMSPSLRDDEEILKVLLLSHPSDRTSQSALPENWIQHFSDRIRSSPRILLEMIIPHGHLSALAYCAQELRNDKEFMLQVIDMAQKSMDSSMQAKNSTNNNNNNNKSNILKYASHRLRADRDVVLQAVKQSGWNLKHAAYPFRRDEEIVRRACEQNPNAFFYCLPGSTKDDLLQDRQFVLHHLIACDNTSWKVGIVNNYYSHDRQIQLKAAIYGLPWDALSPELLESTEFIVQVISHAPNRYMELPESIQELFEVAFQVTQANNNDNGYRADDDTILEATEKCPELLRDRNAMWAIVQRADIFSETLQFSPLTIRNDKELMLRAIQTDPIAFEYCSDDLQHDRDVVLAAVPTSLYLVMDHFQYENPDIVQAAIEKTKRNDLWITYDDICDELWSHRDIAKAWLAKGGDWLGDDFPQEFCDDEELLLTVAKYNWTEFDHASDRLLNDKEFLLQALKLDGRIIRDIPDKLRHDYHLALAAFSNDCRAIQFYSGVEDFEFMVKFAQWIRKQLEEHDTFTKEVVCKVTERPTCSTRKSALSMLNQGVEFVTFYQSMLESYLGLPDKNELEMLKEASKNLLVWGL